MKTLAEIEKGLAERYDGPTFEKNGFTYIPWNESVKQANRVFGIGSYHIEVAEVRQEGEGYMARVRVTVSPSDSNPIVREGVGYNELSTARNAADTAVKGATSDALNRALKLFGDAFGLYLYDKAEVRPDSSQRTTAAPRSAGQSNDRGPSEKQMAVLNKNGYTAEQVAGMTFPQWKGVLDAIFGGQTPAIAPAAKQAAAKTAAPKAKPAKAATEEYDMEPDEIPF